MAQKKKASGNGGGNYRTHADAIQAGQIGSLYIYYGDERYLLEYSVGEVRRAICPDGLSGFNYRRYEGKTFTIDELDDAINTLPVLAERTLIELHDFDIFNCEGKDRLAELFSDLPGYVCIVAIFSTIQYKPDGRQKLDKEILKNAQVVEFSVQDQSMLVKWIARHYKDAGKLISPADAEYLVLITGGFMSSLHEEIEKTAAYAAGETVTRADIDAVVSPVLDAVVFKMTDALIKREYGAAMKILDELLRMRESPQMLIYSISLKMRQLLAARVCIENKAPIKTLIDICGIKFEFQAKILIDTARKTTLKDCREAVILCAETALALNSLPEPETRLTELLVRLAFIT